MGGPMIDDQTLAEIENRKRLGLPTLVISGGKTTVDTLPDAPHPEYRPSATFSGSEWTNRADQIRKQYQDELDSAERLRRQQEQQEYFDRGVRPPSFLSEFSPPSIASIQANRPRFMNVGGDLYDVSSGHPSLAARGFHNQTDYEKQAKLGILKNTVDQLWKQYSTGTTSERARARQQLEGLRGSFDEILGPGQGTVMIPQFQDAVAPAPVAAPAASVSAGKLPSFNSEAEARKAGYGRGQRVIIGGVAGKLN